jgi:NAD+ synthetase
VTGRDPIATRSSVLESLRSTRGFRADAAAAAKVGRLVTWFADQQLDAAVVGLSGGIDSAVTLALLQRAAAVPGSPLRRVVALLVPIDAPGATNQAAATERAARVADALAAEAWEAPFADVQHAATLALEKGSGLTFDGWSAGQLLSVLRTPALYGAVSLLQANGHRPVVVGTTNRDEGAYLGFFGKASDAMVDLQPISDLHKSEVRALATMLDVPAEVLDAEPSGDVWDGRTDAEMIGAPYDGVELVLRLRELELDPSEVADGLSDGDALRAADRAVERLHRTNAHKYVVGSPAVHLDVLPRGVPGGWADEPLSPRHHPRPPTGFGPGEWSPPPITIEPRPSLPIRRELVDGAVAARDVLSEADCDRLLEAMRDHADPVPVGVTGVQASAGVGSMRATAWSPELADQLWRRVRLAAPAMRFLEPTTATDGHATPDRTGHRTWRAVGLSPVLRFMRYEPGGRHLCHYDAGYDYGDGRRTLVSVVLYLTGDPAQDGPAAGGATRLIRDGQGSTPVWERDHRDWDRDTQAHEVLVAVAPRRGTALIFDHRIGHDVQRWNGPGDRVVIRADVVYEAVPDGQRLP